MSVFYLFTIACLTQMACRPARVLNQPATTPALRFLDEYRIPFAKEFQQTRIGGLSGIDYDTARKVYYIISDDRSERFPARFYTARIEIKNEKIDTVVFLNTTLLKNNDGNFYLSEKEDPLHTPDPESIRYNPVAGNWLWTNEGERKPAGNPPVLQDPSVNIINVSGLKIDSFNIPGQFHMQPTDRGPRRNSVFEGATFADNFTSLYISLEEPLYNDGPRAGLDDVSGIIRLIKYDVATRKAIAQYAYRIDPVRYAPYAAGKFIINGVSEILNYDDHRLLIVERAFSTGRLPCDVRVYLADVSGATDVSDLDSLSQASNIHLISKKLLLDMATTNRYIDNIEGITFGPLLPNGNKTLLFISDDNFLPLQKSQILLFEILE